MVSNNVSIVKYLSEETRESCGYCKTNLGSARYGLWAFDLTVKDYQALIDRGWRRCGHYCYKPIIQSACCPMYTIRCSAEEFKPTKSQKRVLKRFNSFINSDIKNSRTVKLSRNDNSDIVLPCEISDDLSDELRAVVEKTFNEEKQSSSASHHVKPTVEEEKIEKCKTSIVSTVHKKSNSNKKKQIRINKKREKLRSQGLTEDEIAKKMVENKRFPVNKNVEDFINDCDKVNAAHTLQVRVVRSAPRSPEFEETYEQSYALYKRYQVLIHKDDEEGISKESYERFLVNSPLLKDANFGSFHQQYWIDGKLIAVGVIDILPKCVSSVYLFYDPDYAFLSLGTYSALRELFLVRSLLKTNQDLAYYYMGYYIRSCPKMRYKGAFHPSFLLCPEVYSWHQIETCLPKIDGNKRERLNENGDAQDEELKSININNIPVIYKRKLKLAGFLDSKILSDKPLREYCSMVGASCSTRMLLSI